MSNIKIQARKFHKVMGIIFALPLLYSATTAVIFAIVDEFLHNEALGDYILKFHTLEIIGLNRVYPFVVLIGVVGLVSTAVIILNKK